MKNDFPWGVVTKTHTIPGLPPIVEYVAGKEWEDAGKTQFQVETATHASVSFNTFDEALLAALCDKYDSFEAAPYVWRLLKHKRET